MSTAATPCGIAHSFVALGLQDVKFAQTGPMPLGYFDDNKT